jgi:hypothetical protein
MTQQNDSIDRMRVASPCSVGWENMSGDDRVRFCNQCSLHVYNISELTKQQVASLVAETEGRICARLYRRADGTVLTRDCPVGLRAVRKRVSKMAGAALTAVLSLCSGLVGQTQSQEGQKCSRIIALKVKKTASKDGQAVFSGIVLDEMGAIIPGATLTLIDERTKQRFTATSSADGQFSIPDLAAGKYGLEIEATGFKSYKQKNLAVNSGEAMQADITLQIDGETVTVGILISDPQIQSSNGTTILSGDLIRKLPLP